MSSTNNISNTNTENTTIEPAHPVKSKRGRKSKKELMETLKNKLDIEEQSTSASSLNNPIISSDTTSLTDEKPPLKKRGRKPKGGKIITSQIVETPVIEQKTNIILHLKCSLNDLNNNNCTNNITEHLHNNGTVIAYNSYTTDPTQQTIGSSVINETGPSLSLKQEYNNYINASNKNNDMVIAYNSYTPESTQQTIGNNIIPENTLGNHNTSSSIGSNIIPEINNTMEIINNNNTHCLKQVMQEDANYQKKINKKIKYLEHNLNHEYALTRKSCCFWDTCEFDNPPIYIPKFVNNDNYTVYGCFCSLECAVAYLMDENIDSSVKFERHQLFNNLYSKVYNNTQNIKPAPNPYYTLDKFYGNLTTQEYRSLLNNERLFLVIDKPITKSLPELHEDNDEFMLNNKTIPTNKYGIRNNLTSNSSSSSSKNEIVNQQFGIV